MDIRHLGAARAGNPQQLVPDPDTFAGFFWGHESLTGTNGWIAHTAYAVRFNSFLPLNQANGIPSARVMIDVIGLPVRPGRYPGIFKVDLLQPQQIPNIMIEQVKVPPGPWQTIKVEIAPTGCSTFWLSPNGYVPICNISAVRLAKIHRGTFNVLLNNSIPRADQPATFPIKAYNPRGSFGIIAGQSSVAFRNVRIDFP
jgi:hypothetical protein